MTNKRILPINIAFFLVFLFATLYVTNASAVCLPGQFQPLDITSPAEICSPFTNSGTINIDIPGDKNQDPKPELKLTSLPLVGGGARASLDNKGAININEGILKNESGTLTNSVGGTININGQLDPDGSVNELKSGILNNAGDRGGFGFSNAGTININEGGALNNSSQFSNKGTIDMAQGSVLNHNNGAFNNLATVKMEQDSAFNMNGGTFVMDGMTFESSAKVDMAQGSAFTINGGTLTGTGTITGTINNVGGVVIPGEINNFVTLGATIGTLNLGGYTQGPNGKLEFKIGNPQGIPFHGTLNVTGDVSLRGGLSVSLFPGFVPKLDDEFDLITKHDPVTGETASFDFVGIRQISLPALPGRLDWLTSVAGGVYNLTVRQVVVSAPEPSSLLLTGLGFAWLVGQHWRKQQIRKATN